MGKKRRRTQADDPRVCLHTAFEKKGRGETDEDMLSSPLQMYYILFVLRKYYISKKKKKTNVLQKYFHCISIKKNVEKKRRLSHVLGGCV